MVEESNVTIGDLEQLLQNTFSFGIKKINFHLTHYITNSQDENSIDYIAQAIKTVDLLQKNSFLNNSSLYTDAMLSELKSMYTWLNDLKGPLGRRDKKEYLPEVTGLIQSLAKPLLDLAVEKQNVELAGHILDYNQHLWEEYGPKIVSVSEDYLCKVVKQTHGNYRCADEFRKYNPPRKESQVFTVSKAS